MARKLTVKTKSVLTRKVFFEGLAVIGNYLKPHKKTVAVLIVMSLITATMGAFVPLLAGKILDAIISIYNNPVISIVTAFTLIIIWFFLRLGGNIIDWYIGFNNERLGVRLESEYIANGFGRLMEMPISFHKDKKQGEVTDKISRASGWLENIVTRVSINLLPEFLSIIIAVIITFFINYQLTLLLIAAIFVYVIILWRSVPQLSGLQQKMFKAYNKAYGNAYDALGNIQEIKQAATEKYEQKKIYKQMVGQAAALWLRMSFVIRKIDFFQRALITLTQLTIFGLSVYFVKNGAITPGELVAFNGYAAMIFGPFVILGQNWQTIQNGLVALVNAEKVLNLPTENYIPKGAITPKKLKGGVVFNNVFFSYKNNEIILRDVSFRANPGEKIAIVGKSGVGKTTIADLILGFYFPQKGSIKVDDIDIEKFNLTAYRSRVGVVPQEPTLFNDTVDNNIRYGNFDAPEAKIKTAAKNAGADEFIENFPKKYQQLVGWRGIKLSTGQKQRIALARAFLRNPDILILDEPTSALDAKSEELIKDSLRKLMIGRTSFIIAHRFSTIKEADKILVLDNGKIVEQGSHDELMRITNGVYKEMYELQINP